jgi:hypothetical protein
MTGTQMLSCVEKAEDGALTAITLGKVWRAAYWSRGRLRRRKDALLTSESKTLRVAPTQRGSRDNAPHTATCR